MTLVLGIDPGQMTGLVRARVDHRMVTDVWDWSELAQREAGARIKLWIKTGADVVVCERWVPRGGALTFKPYSLELIGWTRGLCWEYGVPFVLQAAEMKDRFHDAAITEFPKVGRGEGGHARDALAHVIGWANTRRIG